jgi:NADPH-dependent 2,4-dienoyl-CoA reductase/sulfur reductase-like enzyme
MSNTITRAFNSKIRAALAKKGITIYGVTSVKEVYENGSWGSKRMYQVNDNDCGRVWTHEQVEAAAK